MLFLRIALPHHVEDGHVTFYPVTTRDGNALAQLEAELRRLVGEAAALRAENERLRAALAPFAAYAATLDAAGVPDAAPVRYAPGARGAGPAAGDCRRAAGVV